MASQGPLSPTVQGEDATYGTQPWYGLGTEILASDNTRLECLASGTPGSSDSHYLTATGFGFSIPSGATINGIGVEWEVRQPSSSNTSFWRSRIIKDGSIGVYDLADGRSGGSSDSYLLFGGLGEWWLLNWTPADINDTGFGAAVGFHFGDNTSSIEVDHCRITVFYTELVISTLGQSIVRGFSRRRSNNY